MADNLGAAVIKLGVDGAALNSGLQKAEKQTVGFLTRINSSVSVFASGKLGAAIGGIKSVIDTVINKFVELGGKIDGITKVARGLGIPTERMMGLAHAADLSGVPLEGLQAGMRKLAQNISQAGSGSQTAIDMFAKLGLSAEQLRSAGLEGALGMVADKLEGITDPTEKVRMALDLLGRQGLTITQMFAGGSEALKGLVDEGAKLKGVTDVDAAKVEAANDSYSRLKASIEGAWNKLIVAIAPAVEAFFSLSQTMLTSLMQGFQNLLGPILGLIPGIGGVENSFSTWYKIGVNVLRGISVPFAAILDAVRMLEGGVLVMAAGFVKAFGIVTSAIRKVLEIAGRLPDNLGGDVFKSAARGVKEFEDKVNRLAEGTFKKGGQLIESGLRGDAIKKVNNFYDGLIKKHENAQQAIKREAIDPLDPDLITAPDPVKEKAKEIKTPEALLKSSTGAVTALLQARLASRGGGRNEMGMLVKLQEKEIKLQEKALQKMESWIQHTPPGQEITFTIDS